MLLNAKYLCRTLLNELIIERANRDFLIKIYLNLETNLELDVEAYDLMQFVRECSQKSIPLSPIFCNIFFVCMQKQLIHNLAVDKETKTN